MDNFENNNLHQESNNTEQEFSPKNELPPVTEAELAQSEQAQSRQTNGSLPYEPQDMQADGAVQQTESPQQTDGTLPQYAPQQMPYTPQGQYVPHGQYIPQQEPPIK